MNKYLIRATVSRASILPNKLWQVAQIDARKEIAHFFGVRVDVNLPTVEVDDTLSIWHFWMSEPFVKYGIQASYLAFVMANILADYLPRELVSVACAVLSYPDTQEVKSHEIRKALAVSQELRPTMQQLTVIDLFSDKEES